MPGYLHPVGKLVSASEYGGGDGLLGPGEGWSLSRSRSSLLSDLTLGLQLAGRTTLANLALSSALLSITLDCEAAL